MIRKLKIILLFAAVFTGLAILSALKEPEEKSNNNSNSTTRLQKLFYHSKYYGLDTTETNLTKDNLDSMFNTEN